MAMEGGHKCDKGEKCKRKVQLLWKEFEYFILSAEGEKVQKWRVMEDRWGRKFEEKMVWTSGRESESVMTLHGLPLKDYGDPNVEPKLEFTGDLKCIGMGI
jgi:hypothetical protein